MPSQKDTRSMTSCSECQRRKQKCSREWPCNHCQSRKVPHLCQFGPKKAAVQHESPTQSSGDSKGRKRSLPGSSEGSSLSWEVVPDAPENGLKAWGYMPGHLHYNLGSLSAEDTSHNSDSPPDTNGNQEVYKLLHVFPSRSITDAFVNNFLGTVNYRYNSIYAPIFTEQYVQWWSDRANNTTLSPEFTCLLLRVCAHSGQYLPAQLRKMVEFELATNLQVLTDRFAGAADQLSSSLGTPKACLERIQELFLKCAWLKSESNMVECWHVLGRAIHEAQELGMDKDTAFESLTEFDIEMRRRVWALLYIWDWQMSAWLGRPHLMDQRDCSFTFPSLRLEEDATQPNLLSPFAHIALQAQLARRITTHKGDTVIGDLNPHQVLAIEAECERFIEELPPIFKFESPDLSLDEKHPYFVTQRRQMHVIIYMTMLDFLKPYLTRSQLDSESTLDAELRVMGIDLALQLVKASRRLFDHEFPINARFHLVVFSVFDTATVLCSAVIHDKNNALPHREQIMNAIGNALDMLHQLSLTKIGAASCKFLSRLVEASPVLSRWLLHRKRPRIDAPAPTTNGTLQGVENPQSAFTLPITDSTYLPLDSIPNDPEVESLTFDMDQFLAHNSLGESLRLDIGGLEEIWDWDTLNLDAFLNTDPNNPST